MKNLFVGKLASAVPLNTTVFGVVDKCIVDDWCAALNGDRKRYTSAFIDMRFVTELNQRLGHYVIERDEEVWEELVCEAFSQLQRSEKGLRPFEWTQVRGFDVDIHEMRRCWSNRLKRTAVRSVEKNSIQIDDSSADDI
jgi:hypothetical protein